MELTVKVEKTINVAAVRVVLPVKYGDEDMPYDFPFRKGEQWEIVIDMDTGKIRDWPQGLAYDLSMKVTDGGSYYLLDENDNVVASLQDYVPEPIPGRYGDYVELEINADGTIDNWDPDKGEIILDFFGED